MSMGSTTPPESGSVPGETEAAVSADGESTAHWACQAPGFFGTMKQLISCARCGDGLKGGPSTPRRYRDVFKPSFHFICDRCHDELPA